LAHLVDLGHRLAELAEPAVGLLTDELDAPGQRLGPGLGDAGLDEGVEDLALGLAQPGHDRGCQVGEERLRLADPDAPRDLAAAEVLELAGDLDAALAGVLTEGLDPAAGRDG